MKYYGTLKNNKLNHIDFSNITPNFEPRVGLKFYTKKENVYLNYGEQLIEVEINIKKIYPHGYNVRNTKNEQN